MWDKDAWFARYPEIRHPDGTPVDSDEWCDKMFAWYMEQPREIRENQHKEIERLKGIIEKVFGEKKS